jgi:hypothetical protein
MKFNVLGYLWRRGEQRQAMTSLFPSSRFDTLLLPPLSPQPPALSDSSRTRIFRTMACGEEKRNHE